MVRGGGRPLSPGNSSAESGKCQGGERESGHKHQNGGKRKRGIEKESQQEGGDAGR